MSMKRKWHISLTRTDSSSVTCFSFYRSTGRILAMFGFIFAIGLVACALLAGRGLERLHKWNELNSEKRELATRMKDMLAELDQAENRLALMNDWEDRVREEEHLAPIDASLRKAGIGGAPQVDRTFDGYDKELSETYNQLLERLRQVNGVTQLAMTTHREVLDNVSIRNEIYRSTPSIYPAFGKFAEAFGLRVHPVTGRRDMHRGVDISNDIGTPIYATADGVVTKTTFQRNMGNYVELRHGFGYVTHYGHLSRFLVHVGDEVKKGQIIALMGDTGRTTGPHVHYEVLQYGKYRNPWYFLNKTEDDIRVATE